MKSFNWNDWLDVLSHHSDPDEDCPELPEFEDIEYVIRTEAVTE